MFDRAQSTQCRCESNVQAICVVHAGDSLLGKNIKLDHIVYCCDVTSHSLATMHHRYFSTDSVSWSEKGLVHNKLYGWNRQTFWTVKNFVIGEL